MIRISSLGMAFGGQELFGDTSLGLFPGNIYGLVGANGAGKSTFMKILTGEIKSFTGEVSMQSDAKMGILAQDQFAFDDLSLADAVIGGKKELWTALTERDALLEKDDLSNEEGIRLSELEGTIADHDGYSAESEAAELLAGLGIKPDPFKTTMKQLSGGYRIRVLMARCLYSGPDILLLDEPTNHLDIHSIEWLETYLKNFTGLAVIISHDHSFLNNITTSVLDIDYGEIRLYKGNYDDFLSRKYENLELIEKENVKLKKKADDAQKFIDRFKAKASKARQANSRMKMLDKMDIPEIMETSRRAPHFRFRAGSKSGKVVLKVKDLSIAFGEKKLFSNLNFELERNMKMAIVGENGVGKTSLLKLIVGELKPTTGEVIPGHNMDLGYFSQNHMDVLNEKSTPYEWLGDAFPRASETEIRSLLGRMLFSKDEAMKKNSSLSGGETTRLILGKLMFNNHNFLILDEPTNHMDLETVDAFADALSDFDGTILFVSHNRYFTDKLADIVMEIKPEGIETFEGSYSEYHSKSLLEKAESGGKNSQGKKSETKTEVVNSKEQKKLNSKISKVEELIAGIEKNISQFELALADVKIYESSSAVQLEETRTKLENERESLSRAMAEWEKLQAGSFTDVR